MKLHVGSILLLLLAFAGVADSFNSNDLSTSARGAEGALVAQTSATTAASSAAEAVPGELTADLLYAILLGEIAMQRGDRLVAFAHYLEAADAASDVRLAELATRTALAAEELDATRRGVDLWLALDSESIGAHLVSALVATRRDRQEVAHASLRDVAKLAQSAGRDGFLRVAALITTIAPPAERLALMRSLSELAHEDAVARYALAVVAADAAQHDEAIEASRAALAIEPDWDEPRTLLVRLLIAEGRRQDAREILEASVDAAPKGHVLRMLYAQLLVEDREFSSARNVFERMLHDSPKEPDVLFAIAVLSLQLDDTRAARGYFEELYATGERRDDAAFYLGQIEEAAGELEKALAWYAKVEGDSKRDAEVRAANIYALQGDIDKARETLAQLRARAPEHAQTLFLIEGEMLRDHDHAMAALAVFNEALAEHPDSESLLYARALHAVSMGQIDVLERDLRRILASNPDHADALNALGYTLADQTERYQEAYDLIQKALTLKPEEPAILDSMGWVLFRMGRYSEAIDFLRRAHERMPDGEISAHLGEALWVSGQRDAAWQVWDEALAADPDHEYLNEVIERFRYSRPGDSR